MGYLDSEVVFSIAQAPTAIGDTASTNVYDCGSVGAGDNGQTTENLWINVVVNTAMTSGGSATMQAVFQDSPDNSTFTDRVVGTQLAYNATAAGVGKSILLVQPPPGTQRYWRIVYRIGTAVLTAGKFDAQVQNTIQLNVPRAVGFAVS